MPPENTKKYFSSSFSILNNLISKFFENFDFSYFFRNTNVIKSEISQYLYYISYIFNYQS